MKWLKKKKKNPTACFAIIGEVNSSTVILQLTSLISAIQVARFLPFHFLECSSVCLLLEKGSSLENVLCFVSKRMKRFKRTLFMRTKYSMQILGVIPFVKLQNET